jgi:hypothetical protein
MCAPRIAKLNERRRIVVPKRENGMAAKKPFGRSVGHRDGVGPSHLFVLERCLHGHAHDDGNLHRDGPPQLDEAIFAKTGVARDGT